MQHRRLLAGVLFALGTLSAESNAQDTTQSLAGSTRVALDVSYVRPRYSLFRGSAAVVPFLNDHWQVGVSPTWEVDGGVQHYYVSGGGEVVANYFPRGGGPSQPYVGVFGSQYGASFATGSGIYGLQAGWLRFLSPSVALRSEFRYRHYSLDRALDTEELLVAFDPYLFGVASRSLTALPSFGVFDATLVADYTMRPQHSLAVNATLAPFLTRWLQAGSSANVLFAFSSSSGSHQVELFGRGYLPLDVRLVPFGEVFVGNESVGESYETVGSRGTRAGVRTYLTPGVALDVAIQWRTYSGGSPLIPEPNRTIRATLTTQFRARRARE
ncbi:MAG TPA: hypothetical protein VJN70_12505 [Gemmatimonadaceae bacterium]|nr:hypothetical protein [Gemmatimonadaceae bacterium]